MRSRPGLNGATRGIGTVGATVELADADSCNLVTAPASVSSDVVARLDEQQPGSLATPFQVER